MTDKWLQYDKRKEHSASSFILDIKLTQDISQNCYMCGRVVSLIHIDFTIFVGE